MSTNEPPAYPDGTPPAPTPPSSGGYPPPGGYPPAGGYPPPGGYPPAPGGYGHNGLPPRRNTKALLSMIFGIIAVVFLCITFGGVFGLVSIPLGIVSLREINDSRGAETGKGMAITGIVTGIIAVLIMIGIIALVVSGALDGMTVES